MLSQLLAVAVLAATHVSAQTYTDCNPLNSTCSADPALGTAYNATFNATQTQFDPNLWNVTAGTDLISFTDAGAELTIKQQGDSVTVQTSFYIFWGQVEIMMQAAAGQGIISTLNLLSDDLDEIDWEIMGGNSSFVESNYYGHGNLSQHNAQYHPSSNVEGEMHNYTVNWTQEQIQWILDGNVVRTQPYAPSGLYPQTPSFIKFGIWAGGDPTEPEGTIVWAGGPTDYSKGPFVMTVGSIKITDGSTNTSSYIYGDQTGSYQSIKETPGISEAAKSLTSTSQSLSQSVEQHWSGLSKGAKIGIACAVMSVFAVAVIAWTACCIVQRKRGRAERALADKNWENDRAELMNYQKAMKEGGFAVGSREVY